MIEKENNFAQPGARYRSWEPARQQRFITRISEIIGDPRASQVSTSMLYALFCSHAIPFTLHVGSLDTLRFTVLQRSGYCMCLLFVQHCPK